MVAHHSRFLPMGVASPSEHRITVTVDAKSVDSNYGMECAIYRESVSGAFERLTPWTAVPGKQITFTNVNVTVPYGGNYPITLYIALRTQVFFGGLQHAGIWLGCATRIQANVNKITYAVPPIGKYWRDWAPLVGKNYRAKDGVTLVAGDVYQAASRFAKSFSDVGANAVRIAAEFNIKAKKDADAATLEKLRSDTFAKIGAEVQERERQEMAAKGAISATSRASSNVSSASLNAAQQEYAKNAITGLFNTIRKQSPGGGSSATGNTRTVNGRTFNVSDVVREARQADGTVNTYLKNGQILMTYTDGKQAWLDEVLTEARRIADEKLLQAQNNTGGPTPLPPGAPPGSVSTGDGGAVVEGSDGTVTVTDPDGTQLIIPPVDVIDQQPPVLVAPPSKSSMLVPALAVAAVAYLATR